MRRLAGNDPEVNEEWITDKDRFAFPTRPQADRLTYPQVRDEDGALRPRRGPRPSPSRPAGLRGAPARVGVLTGGRVTAEDAYAYSKFARVALGTNDIDFRARPHSAEEAVVPRRRGGADRSRGGGDVRRPRDRRDRRAGRARARGRGRHDLPAAAQGRPRRRHPGPRDRAVHHPRPDQDERHAGPDRARRRARRPRRPRRPRRLRRRRHRRDPGRRAARDRARRAHRRRRAGREDRRPAGLGAASRR